VTAIDIGVGDNVAESEDEFEAEFGDRFAAEFVVRSVADMPSVIDLTKTGAGLLSMPMETESLSTLMRTRSESALPLRHPIDHYESPELPRVSHHGPPWAVRHDTTDVVE